ncbi:MAG: hypothetical protein AAGI13_05690 [Pseudomonadota bacterium]
MTESFQSLRAILLPYAEEMFVMRDDDEVYCLDTHHIMKNGKRMFFASARVSKTYTSFHLMPVYVSPALLTGMSEPLAKRMQGKSCFNFEKPDAALFAELSELTARGHADYRARGYLGA